MGVTDKKTVIQALAYGFGNGVCKDHEFRFADMPEPYNVQKLMGDALELLIAQEPRVMTLEEYKVWADIPFCERDPIFLEMKSRRGSETWWTNIAECSIENYGKTERCWIARPDEKVRQETPWE